MSDLITQVDCSNGIFKAVHSQDVEDIKKSCYDRRQHATVKGARPIGYLECEIPLVEIINAKNNGIDLHDRKQRNKWLRLNPQYICYVDKG